MKRQIMQEDLKVNMSAQTISFSRQYNTRQSGEFSTVKFINNYDSDGGNMLDFG